MTSIMTATEMPEDPLGKQEIYDHNVAYFSRPDAVLAWEEDSGECQYRAFIEDRPEAVACAFGCVIPNLLYTDGIEGVGVKDILKRDGYRDLIHESAVEFLIQLQTTHDNIAANDRDDVETYLQAIDVIAYSHGLKVRGGLPEFGKRKTHTVVEYEQVTVGLSVRKNLPPFVEAEVQRIAENAMQAGFRVIAEELGDVVGGRVFGDMSPGETSSVMAAFRLFVGAMAVNAVALQDDDEG